MANAADPRQVRDAGRKVKRREQRFLDALRTVMSTAEGRLVFGEREIGLLARAGVFRSIWARDASIHYNAGRQDYGHELLALLTEADEALYLTMEAEMRALARREAASEDATGGQGNG